MGAQKIRIDFDDLEHRAVEHEKKSAEVCFHSLFCFHLFHLIFCSEFVSPPLIARFFSNIKAAETVKSVSKLKGRHSQIFFFVTVPKRPLLCDSVYFLNQGFHDIPVFILSFPSMTEIRTPHLF